MGKYGKIWGNVSDVDFDKITTKSLHDKLDCNMLGKMKKVFDKNGCLEPEAFRKLLKNVAHTEFSDEDYKNLLKKISSETYGCITWSELLGHIITGFQEAQEEDTEDCGSSLVQPICEPPKMFKSRHRHYINRIDFYPEITHTRTINYLYGSYITTSKDGVINYWSVDMKLQKTVVSTCPLLQVQTTMVLDMIGMPDVGIVCTSSAERDLRFYDTTAKKFQLIMMITSFPNAICSLSYKFYKDIEKQSKLILGDMGGIVRIFEFNSKDKGPFQAEIGGSLVSCTWEQFKKGSIPLIKLIEFPTVHAEWVLQVGYYDKTGFVISIAPCGKYSMILHHCTDPKASYIFSVHRGFWCMTYEKQGSPLIATGGPDSLVRVWNPYVTKREVAVLRGHHGGIVALIFQNNGRILCSISQDRTVKVWDVFNQKVLQTYKQIPESIGHPLRFATYYNPGSRQVFVGGTQIAMFHLYPLLNGDYTDGFTHSKDVSVILYNTLFEVVVTCGYDSYIIVWDYRNGRRVNVKKDAHSINIDGLMTTVAITAATFSSSNQLLATGAEDGSLKIWRFNTGVCVRNLSIGTNVINAIVWLNSRILVMGDNRTVAEFSENSDVDRCYSKDWVTRHTHDILCATGSLPHSLVTGSYNGELIFWSMETGQAYGMYNVEFPLEKITLKCILQKDKRKDYERPSSKSSVKTSWSGHSLTKKTSRQQLREDRKKLARKKSSLLLFEDCGYPTYSIQAILFLETRPTNPNIATLIVAVATGEVQLWSHASTGGFIASFNPCHIKKDYVRSMTTDKQNEFLITGHYAGYIKIWLIKNIGWPKDHKVDDICMPLLRLKFPFMWGDTFVGRAQKATRHPGCPILLSSYLGHYQTVNYLAYIDENEILISCSTDCTTRMWTIGGKYLCTLGSFKPFDPIDPEGPVPPDRECVLPADIKRNCSSTTLRVLSGGSLEKPLTKKQKMRRDKNRPTVIKGVYGNRVPLDKILGNHFQMPPRCKQPEIIELDTTCRQIPTYKELRLHPFRYLKRKSSTERIESGAKLLKRRATSQNLMTMGLEIENEHIY